MALQGIDREHPNQQGLDDLAISLGNDTDIIEINNTFERVFGRLIEKLNKPSDKLDTDYHVVIINEKRNKRYSIIEGNNPTFADKPKNYGIVGSLITQELNKYQSIYVQFRASEHNSIIAYTEQDNGKVKKIPPKTALALFGGNPPTWEPDKDSKFAIATILIKNKTNTIIGACSIDFDLKSGKEYPDFSFREHEIKEIFDVLHCMKDVFELLQTSTASRRIQSIIKKIREAQHDKK